MMSSSAYCVLLVPCCGMDSRCLAFCLPYRHAQCWAVNQADRPGFTSIAQQLT